MALLTERCLFINFPFYHKTFLSEVDFDWQHHTQRLLSFGHDVTKIPPHQIQVCVNTRSSATGVSEHEAIPSSWPAQPWQHKHGR